MQKCEASTFLKGNRRVASFRACNYRNFTSDAFPAVADYLGCNNSSIRAQETLYCLQAFDIKALLNASLEVYIGYMERNNCEI